MSWQSLLVVLAAAFAVAVDAAGPSFYLQQQQQQPNNLNLNNNNNNGFNGGSSSSINNPLMLQQQQQLANGNFPIEINQPFGQQDNAQPPAASLSARAPEPRPVLQFRAESLNSSSVKLIWNMHSGYHIDSFDIEYGPVPESTQTFQINNLNGSTRDYIVHNINPDLLYQFALIARDGDKSYKPFLMTYQKLNNSPKNSQPTLSNQIIPFNVRAEGKSNSSILITWSEKETHPNMRILTKVNVIRYQVTSSSNNNSATINSELSVNNQPDFQYTNSTNNRENRLLLSNLKPATEYTLAVKTMYYYPESKKLFSQSSFSMDTQAKTFNLEPSAPRNFNIKSQMPTRDESLNGQEFRLELSWQAPESPNGVVKGYVILYAHDRDLPDERWSRIEVKEATLNSWYVSNLKPGISYYFKMRAINQKGFSSDSDIIEYVAPPNPPTDKIIANATIPTNNKLIIMFSCMVLILFVLSLLITKLTCCSKPKKSSKKVSLTQAKSNLMATNNGSITGLNTYNNAKLNGFASTNSSSTVAARVGTLARRRENASTNKQQQQDFWINAMEQQQPDLKSNISEKSTSDMNVAMVSIQRNSPQFATTQLAPALPEYRFATSNQAADQHLAAIQQQHPQQSHYHAGQFAGALAYDQMDNATASALMTLTKRQQQQMQKYQIQFASTGIPTTMASSTMMHNVNQQAPSPHQQPPPPPPLNIEQQQQQQQPLYGTHTGNLANTRSLRLNRPTLYDPVSGSFVQSLEGGPPNYNSHTNHIHQNHMPMTQFSNQQNSSTLQFHPHQSSTLLSRRSTNTLRSFQNSGPTYGQLGGASANQFGHQPAPVNSLNGIVSQLQQPQQLLQSHQAVINQLNNSTYPSLPLKHVSAVRPQIMSSLEDQIETELAEKVEQLQQDQQQQTIKQ